MARKGKVNKLIHRGIFHLRTKIADAVGIRERVFAQAWEQENIPRGRFQSPAVRECSLLESLVRDNERLLPVTQDTATAVATIFQWLASPVGFAFLTEVLKKAGYSVVPIKKKE